MKSTTRRLMTNSTKPLSQIFLIFESLTSIFYATFFLSLPYEVWFKISAGGANPPTHLAIGNINIWHGRPSWQPKRCCTQVYDYNSRDKSWQQVQWHNPGTASSYHTIDLGKVLSKYPLSLNCLQNSIPSSDMTNI